MNRNALRLTIAIVRKMMPLIFQLLKAVEDAKSEDSEGGKAITKNEKWAIAEEASFQILPSIIETIADSLE
tara:strand:- start:735 stop:947 length:213 start_codon:yes stop_codon:yes gene_type:complete